MAIADVKVLTFHLTSDRGVCYEFTPVGEDVRVRRLAGRSTYIYNLPADEARKLWANLRKRGYERW